MSIGVVRLGKELLVSMQPVVRCLLLPTPKWNLQAGRFRCVLDAASAFGGNMSPNLSTTLRRTPFGNSSRVSSPMKNIV
jgi:hypothetical protein